MDNPSDAATPSRRPRPRPARRALRLIAWIGWSAAGLALLLLLIPGLLRLQPCRDLAARLAAAGIGQASGLDVRLVGLHGAPPFSLALDRLVLADASGVFLVVSDLRFSWSPFALLSGKIRVENLSADVIRLTRLPSLPEEPEKPATLTWPPRFPTPPPLLLDRLAVSRIILDAPVAGQEAVFSLSGRLADSGGALGLTLDLTRLGGPPGRLAVSGALNYAAWTLLGRASLTEDPGGLVGSLLAGPEAGALALTVSGSGSLNDWRGDIKASLGHDPLITARLGLSAPLSPGARAVVSLDGAIFPPPGLLPGLPRVDVGLTAGADLSGPRSGLDRLSLTAGGLTLSAHAAMDTDADAISGQAVLAAASLTELGPDLSGSVRLAAELSGRLSRPVLNLDVRGSELGFGPARLTALATGFRVTPAGDLGRTFPGATLTGQGTLTGPAGDLALDLSATTAPNLALDLERLRLSGPAGRLDLSGGYDPGGTFSAKMDIDLADLAAPTALVGTPLSGSAAIKGQCSGATSPPALSASLGGQIRDLGRGGPARGPESETARLLAALFGPLVRFDLSAATRPDGALVLDRADVEAGALRIAANGSHVPATDALAASLRLSGLDLANLAPVLGPGLAGRVGLEASVSGTAAAPRLSALLTGHDLAGQGMSLSEVRLSATAEDLARAPRGGLELGLSGHGQTAGLVTDYALAGHRLRLSGLRLSAPGAALSGELLADTAGGAVTGTLRGGADDLSGLGRLLGLRLAGSAQLDLTLAERRGKPEAAASLTARNLTLPGLSLASARISATVADPALAPSGTLELGLTGLSAEGVEVARLDLSAKGDGRKVGFELSGAGRLDARSPFDLAAKGLLAPEPRQTRLTLASLGGTFLGQKLSLARPAAFLLGPEAFSVDRLDASLGKTRLTASGGVGPAASDLILAVEGFSLGMLTDAGEKSLAGTAGLTLKATGPAARPEVALDLGLTGARLGGDAAKGLPPASVSATARLAAGKLATRTEINGLGGARPVTLELDLPARLGLAPVSFELSRSAELAGRLSADTDLSGLAPLLASLGTRLTGKLTAEATVSGTLDRPRLAGDMVLTATKLENAASGAVLLDLTARLAADGTKVSLTELSARDPRGGRLSGGGSVDFASGPDGPAAAEIALKDLRVAGLDLVTATADGRLSLSGTLSRPRLSGGLTLGPVDVNLPTGLPPDVVVIEVKEVGRVGGGKAGAAAAHPTGTGDGPRGGADGPGIEAALDLTVELGQAVYVRGLGLESRWTGKIAVAGASSSPLVTGKFTSERGRIELFGADMTLTKGEVTFTGSRPPRPVLDIAASTTSGDVTAGVTVTGDAANPKIGLFSNPPLPRDEILSRILFGQGASSISPLQALQLAQAASALMGGGSTMGLLSRTRRLLNLDELQIVPGTGGVETSKVRVGKHLTKGVMVNLDQGMGAQSGAVSVEVEITPNITVESRVGADSKQGVGVNWKFDY